MILRRLAVDALHAEYARAEPFPHLVIDAFLDRRFAVDVGHELASGGTRHPALPVSDRTRPVAALTRLSEALRAPEFRQTLSELTGIPDLLVDENVGQGGLQRTSRLRRINVRADFNGSPGTESFRRLNLMLFLNPLWEEGWGGELELWDKDVKVCHQRLLPILGRCVLFETSPTSFHGMTRVRSPRRIQPHTVALSYATREAPADQDACFGGPVFRARPDEHLKRKLLVPLENRLSQACWHASRLWQRVRSRDHDRHGRTAS